MQSNPLKKAVIYCRVSTKEQAEEGNSLATQERNCREYCLKHEYEIAQIFIEEGESAKTADRTELQKLLKFCCDKKQGITAVVIYKIDRLSRNTDDYSQLRILLKRYEVEIKSTSEYFENNTPAGRFMENIIANVAQFDNDVRTERSVGGMKDAVRSGRYVWMAPVGYINSKVDGKSTIIQDEKAPLVRKAFELMAENKFTINDIRMQLFSMGLKSKTNKLFTRSHFYSVLNNKLYAGWICKFGQQFKGAFEPVIPEELYDRVQYIMKRKKPTAIYRKEHPDFPLRRFVKDSYNNKLTGSWSTGRNKKYAYYRFVQTKQQWEKEVLENAYSKFIDKYAIDESIFNDVKQQVINEFSINSTQTKENIALLTSRKTQLKEKQNLLVQKNISGIFSDAILKEQLSIIEEEIWDIDKRLMQREENKVDVKTIFDYAIDFLIYPSMTWLKMPFDIKLKLQWFQFPQGVTYDGKEFRTTKISSLFKLKEFFSTQLSFNVPHSGLDYEHTDSANSSPSISPQLQEIVSELQRLERIINPPELVEEEPWMSLAA